MKSEFPILEFDESREAVIEPQKLFPPVDIAEHCVITFFGEVVAKVRETYLVKTVHSDRWESGMVYIYEMEHNGRRVAFGVCPICAPSAAVFLEEAIARGCRKFMVCGGAGVLDREIAKGKLMVPNIAVRDEGTSYHYLPPAREVAAHPEAVAAIEATLKEKNIEYIVGKTWTTDAICRETPAKVQLRRSEGCISVEMEASAFFAVAQFRGVKLGQILYAGDDVSGLEWDDRRDSEWQPSVREQLFWLAVEACLKL